MLPLCLALWALGFLPPVPVPAPPRLPVARLARLEQPLMDSEIDHTFQGCTVPNKQQSQAIRSDRDAVLLLAPPGTGKTRCLRARLAYLLNKGEEPSRILVVTFTNHAAQQLKLSVGALANGGMGCVWTGTFHSVCSRMLRENAALLGLAPSFVVLIEKEQIALLADLMQQASAHGARVTRRL
jgi:DNA helicase-2/ATP-dependent DNA helicase PcrA